MLVSVLAALPSRRQLLLAAPPRRSVGPTPLAPRLPRAPTCNTTLIPAHKQPPLAGAFIFYTPFECERRLAGRRLHSHRAQWIAFLRGCTCRTE